MKCPNCKNEINELIATVVTAIGPRRDKEKKRAIVCPKCHKAVATKYKEAKALLNNRPWPPKAKASTTTTTTTKKKAGAGSRPRGKTVKG